ncbi:MAG TPA: PEP-CTERM sorting domain-containing protein, partial [Bryobacteraceae bacterium]|nr:PEP-CTERM sorting domain-containing protein [Bryobacteraceae bacterium]
YWVVPGSEMNGVEELIGVDRHGNAYLLSGVTQGDVSFAGTGSFETLQVCSTAPNECPNFSYVQGAVTPEPTLLPLCALGLLGLWFVRRRKSLLRS